MTDWSSGGGSCASARAEPVEAALYDADRRMYMDKERQATAGSEKT